MSDDRPEEITDSTEKKVWDSLVADISNIVKQLSIPKFMEYKLRLHLITNQAAGVSPNNLNNKGSLQKQIKHLAGLEESFVKYYKLVTDKITSLKSTYADKPRILIMLDTASQNLKRIYAYFLFDSKNSSDLQEEFASLPPAQEANVADVKPSAGG